MILFKIKVRKFLFIKMLIIFGVGFNLFVIFNLDYFVWFFFLIVCIWDFYRLRIGSWLILFIVNSFCLRVKGLIYV